MSSGDAKQREDLIREIAIENRRSTVDGVFLFQALAARSGMNLTDLQCVTLLIETGAMTAGQLAERMALTTGAVTGLINRLEKSGYVRRERDPSDGRRVVIQPMLEALSRVDVGVLVEHDDVLSGLLGDFDDAELVTVLKLLRKSNAFTHDAIARLRAPVPESDDGVFRTPLQGVDPMRLVFSNGVARQRGDDDQRPLAVPRAQRGALAELRGGPDAGAGVRRDRGVAPRRRDLDRAGDRRQRAPGGGREDRRVPELR